jgi:hypothetical protein
MWRNTKKKLYDISDFSCRNTRIRVIITLENDKAYVSELNINLNIY